MGEVTDLSHRWSGWPGAWCLDCGISDPLEACLASGELDFFCKKCGEGWPQGPCPLGGDHDIGQVVCPAHEPRPCEHPGENLFNPYSFDKEAPK